MTTLTPLVLRYVGERRRRGEISPITARNIRNHLMHFAELHGHRPVQQLGPKSVLRWIEQMEDEGLAKSTQALRISSLRTFARWCVVEGLVQKDWTISTPKIRRSRQTPRDLEAVHVSLMLEACHGARDRLTILLMYGCGLRCVEVSRLHVDDLDTRTGLMHVSGKFGHERQIPVPDLVRRAIDAYLGEAGHGLGPLLRSELHPAQGLSSSRISGIVRRIIFDAGVKVRNYDGRSAHGLRAAAATDLYRACHDPQVVQQFLGHANLQTTSIYLQRAEVERVRAAQLLRPLSLSPPVSRPADAEGEAAGSTGDGPTLRALPDAA